MKPLKLPTASQSASTSFVPFVSALRAFVVFFQKTRNAPEATVVQRHHFPSPFPSARLR